MNKYIKQGLEKTKVAVIPPYDDNTTNLLIVKGQRVQKEIFAPYSCYKVHISESLVKPCDWYNTIHNNWNEGIAPDDTFLNIEVQQVMGKMVKVKSSGVNSHSFWEGWLPKGNIDIIEEL